MSKKIRARRHGTQSRSISAHAHRELDRAKAHEKKADLLFPELGLGDRSLPIPNTQHERMQVTNAGVQSELVNTTAIDRQIEKIDELLAKTQNFKGNLEGDKFQLEDGEVVSLPPGTLVKDILETIKSHVPGMKVTASPYRGGTMLDFDLGALAESEKGMKAAIREERKRQIAEARAKRHRAWCLLDEAHFTDAPDQNLVKLYQEAKPKAQRFLLDIDASIKLGEFLRECGDLVMDNLEFARPPYEHTYIEIAQREFFEAWHPGARFRPDQMIADERLGLFTTGEHTFTLFRLDAKVRDRLPHDAYVDAFVWRKGRPQSKDLKEIFDLPVPFAEVTLDKSMRERGFLEDRVLTAEIIKMSHLFGGRRYHKILLNNLTESLQPERAVRLLAEGRSEAIDVDFSHLSTSFDDMLGHSRAYDLISLYRKNDSIGLIDAAFSGSGAALIHATVLLLLGQPQGHVLDLETKPREISLYKGKRLVYQAYSIVHLHLDPKPGKSRRTLLVGMRSSPCGHNVMGHWKHRGGEPGLFEHCVHEYEPISPYVRTKSGDFKYYMCPNCLRRRTWTEGHPRGDWSKGHTDHHYDVHR